MWFLGDCHGCFDTYWWIIRHMDQGRGRKIDCSIQVGDMGIFDDGDSKRLLVSVDKQHRFIRGNHDNPELCNHHPNYLGDYGYASSNIFWISGGYSIDRARRTQGIDWWPDEELDTSILRQIIDIYADIKPTIMVSHECPLSIGTYILNKKDGFSPDVPRDKIKSKTCQALQAMFDIHKPEIWIFGHYHYYMDQVLDGTRFVGLHEMIDGPPKQCVFELPGVSW